MFKAFEAHLRPSPPEEIQREHADRLNAAYILDQARLQPLVQKTQEYLKLHPDAEGVIHFVRYLVDAYLYTEMASEAHQLGLDFLNHHPHATTDEIILHTESRALSYEPQLAASILFRYILDRVFKMLATPNSIHPGKN